MALVRKTPLPDTAHLWSMVQDGDFIDGYAVASPLPPLEAAQIGLSMPRWAMALLHLRNLIVAPFGLKTETDADETDDAGAIFPVTYQSDSEVILGNDDRHLNFRISVMQQNGEVHMATWVHRNNLFGRLYLVVVMPFHILIVRDAMRRIARHTVAVPIASGGSTQ